MKLKEMLEHIIFGFILSGVFGLFGFVILLLPIFFSNNFLEIILRISGFTLFEVILFISGVIHSIKYDKEVK